MLKGNEPGGQKPTPTPAPGGAMSSAFQQAQANQGGQSSAPPNPGYTGGAPNPPSGGYSFRNLGVFARSAMGRTPASEVLSKTTKALSALYEEQAKKSFEITILPIDMNSTTTLSVSALVVALRDKQALDLGVSYHTLILEASAEPRQPKFENINNINTEIITTVGDAWENTLITVVEETVRAQFPQSKLISADACVVPRDFKLEDPQQVFNLASNALFACSSELETSMPGFPDLDLANAERDSTLTVRTSFANQQMQDAVGLPVRSDIRIDFSAAPANQQQGQQQLERVTPLAHIGGFLDLTWDPTMLPNNAYAAYAAPQQQSYQRYAARFVATSLEMTQLLTIPAQLLALLPVLALRENNQWIQAFRPLPHVSGVDMRDIGAIGIEVNFENDPSGFGQRIDTKADKFNEESLARLVTATIKPGIIISLDVPECGTSTWYNGVFAAAAEGNMKANQAIIDAANKLTHGRFGNYFPNGGRVAVDENNRIHLGYYVDGTGIRKDIRDIDYLAILNMYGQSDPVIIKDWSDTFLKSGYPLALRLASRKRIIQGRFGDVTITGFARRVTFEAEFIKALDKAAQEAGLVIRAVGSYADMSSYERATAGYAQNTLITGDSSGLFSRGNFGQTQPMGGNRSFGNRWGG